MRVIALKPLREFWDQHPDSETPLRIWFKLATNAKWESLLQLRADLPKTDGIKNRRGEILTVFNIAGNKYRLIARIRYDYQLINVRDILTHAEYDKEKWKA